MPGRDGALLFNCFVGTREKRRRDREAERRSLGSPHGLAPGLVRGFQRFTSQKNVFAPKFKTLFGSLKTNFPGCGRGERIIVGDRSNRAAALLTDQFVRSKTVPPRERQ